LFVLFAFRVLGFDVDKFLLLAAAGADLIDSEAL
jgi:hypothetical protein